MVVIKERKSKVWKQITTQSVAEAVKNALLSKNVNLKFEDASPLPNSQTLAKRKCWKVLRFDVCVEDIAWKEFLTK